MTLDPYDGYFWQGDEIRLRPVRKSDALQKWREWTDTDARRRLQCQLDLPPVSLETYEAELADSCEFKDTTKRVSFSIESLSGEFAGWINLFKVNPKDGTFMIGVSIFREHRRMGYAEEAMRIVLRYAFFELRYHKCNNGCLATNQASIRLHEKLGFVKEGVRRESVYMDGKHVDDLMFGMTRGEFEATEGR